MAAATCLGHNSLVATDDERRRRGFIRSRLLPCCRAVAEWRRRARGAAVGRVVSLRTLLLSRHDSIHRRMRSESWGLLCREYQKFILGVSVETGACVISRRNPAWCIHTTSSCIHPSSYALFLAITSLNRYGYTASTLASLYTARAGDESCAMDMQPPWICDRHECATAMDVRPPSPALYITALPVDHFTFMKHTKLMLPLEQNISKMKPSLNLSNRLVYHKSRLSRQ
jgi:hypothetical protein